MSPPGIDCCVRGLPSRQLHPDGEPEPDALQALGETVMSCVPAVGTTTSSVWSAALTAAPLETVPLTELDT